MAGWILVPCLVTLRSEFNAIAPNRDKSSDGSIGDTAHAAGGSSDHLPDEHYAALRNKDADATPEVHAIDVDVDLRTPGLTMETVVQRILTRCRSGAEKRLRYIIYNRRIWSASNGWRQQTYTGANPHDHHAHFSASYETALEASTASWHLTEEDDVALTADDKKWLTAEIARQVAALAPQKVWEYKLPNGKTAHGTLIEANLRSGSAANDQLPKLATALAGYARGQVDAATLTAMLTPALTEAIVSRLPQDHDDVTTAELKDAIVLAARDLLA